MSRLVGTCPGAQLLVDIPLLSVEGEPCESRSNQLAWEKWSTDATEQQVAKLMEDYTESATQFVQSKGSWAQCQYHPLPPCTARMHHRLQFFTTFEPNAPS